MRSEKPPIVLIGASTGGVAALEQVLRDLHVDGPPVLIVQHMPGAFLVSFAQMLNRTLPQDVALAQDNEILGLGQIRFAPALGSHTHLRRVAGQWMCQFAPDTDGALHCPSVDELFLSARPFATDIIGAILTGLGRDGAEGLKALRDGGALTLGQDAATSVVYGMPRAAWDCGAVEQQVALEHMGDAINTSVSRHAEAKRRTGRER